MCWMIGGGKVVVVVVKSSIGFGFGLGGVLRRKKRNLLHP